MKVRDLQAVMEMYTDMGYGDCDVRIAIQPTWPLALRIRDAKALSEVDSPRGEDEAFELDGDPERTIVWLVSGGHPDGPDDSPYAPRQAFG